MEGLVNYSSEDEQDEKNYKSAAVRGTHLRRTPPTHAAEQMRRRGGNGVGSSSSSAAPGANTSGGGRIYKEEARYTSTSSAYSSNRSNSQSYNSRENRGETRDTRDHRDTRENRDLKDNSTKEYRDTRDHSNGNKSDFKHDRFNRSKEYDNRDHRRDESFRDQRRPRDDRNQRGGGGNYNNNRNFSQQKDNRYNNNNRHNDSFTPRRHQRSHDDRDSRDSRSDRHGPARKQRSPASHSPSPPSSSSHSKRYSNRGDEHRNRNRACSRSRSRSQSRSPHSHKRSPSPRPTYKPLDQARNTALDLERKLNASEPKLEREPSRSETLRHTEAVLTLPLSDTAPKPPTVIAVAPISSSGSSEPAVIQLPSYYNPSVINPNKYAEQVQKRKLIWGAKKAEDTSAKWGHAQFSQDSDGKVASKFMRLMGIKGGVAQPKPDSTPTETERQPVTVTDVKSREKMFNSMEQQYEVARQVTHTMRGVGLGFGSQTRPF